MALAFAERGDRVAVHYRGARDRAEQVLDRLPGDGHLLVQGDLADPAAVQGFVQSAARGLGRVDVLVNNAALFTDDPGHLADGGSRRVDHRVDEVGYDDWVAAWRRTVEVNLLGTANVTWCVVRQMLDVPAAEGVPTGRVVNVGSRGAYRGEPDVPAYGASKAAVHAFGQSMALALGAARHRRRQRRARGSSPPTWPAPCSTARVATPSSRSRRSAGWPSRRRSPRRSSSSQTRCRSGPPAPSSTSTAPPTCADPPTCQNHAGAGPSLVLTAGGVSGPWC